MHTTFSDSDMINDLASEIFWSFVFEKSLGETGYPTRIEDISEDLLSREILITKMTSYGVPFKNDVTRQNFLEEIYHAVAETIIEHNQQNRNIVGTLFVEDFKLCKQPNFLFDNMIEKLRTDADDLNNYGIKLTGNFLYDGDLLLRTPLPSGILIKSEIREDCTFYIPNTLKALGFKKTLILFANDYTALHSNEFGYKYFVTGTFNILTQTEYSKTWLKLIPNSISTLHAMNIVDPQGVLCGAKILNRDAKTFHNIFKKTGKLFNFN